MSESCGLPNVDIFDPVQCTKRWNQCATQQQINVYLNSEIVRTQECLQLFKTAQSGVNDILDGKIKNHETRIAAIESAQGDLTTAKGNLEKQMVELQSVVVKHQTDTDNSLKLYQASINALTNTTNTLTAGQESLWAELNALKGSIDPAKLQQAIAGYEAIMSETKALIEANNTALDIKFQQLDTKFNTLESGVLNALSEQDAKTAKRIADIVATVNSDIEAQNVRLNSFVNSTTAAVSDLQNDVAAIQAAIDKVVADNTDAHADLSEQIEAAKCAVLQRLAAEEQARKDGDQRLEGMLKTVEKDSKERIDALEESVKTDINVFEQNVDNKLMQMNNDIRDRTDKDITALDDKLTAQLKVLDVREAADNKTTNERIDALSKEIGAGVDDRIAASAATINERITKVEAGAQADNAALEQKLNKTIAANAATANSGLEDLTKLVNTQGELITASRDEATLAWEKEVKDRIAGDEANAKAISEVKATVSEGADKVNERFDKLEDDLTEVIGDAVKATNERLDAVEASDAKQWTTINNVVESQNNTVAKLDKMAEVVDKLDPSQVELVGEKVDALEAKVDAIDLSKLDDLEPRVEAVEKQGEAVVAAQATLTGRVDVLEQQQKAQVETDTKQDLRLDALEKAVDESGYDDTEIKDQIKSLQSVGEANATAIGETQVAVSELEAAVAAIKPVDTSSFVTEEQLSAVNTVAEGAKALADTNAGAISDVQAQANKTDATVAALPKAPITKTAIVKPGASAPEFNDGSGQAVRLDYDAGGSKVVVRFSNLHHIAAYTMSGGSTSTPADQNGSLTMRGMLTIDFLPRKAGYKPYRVSAIVENSLMYYSITELDATI